MKFSAIVVYPVYVTVEADDIETAEQLAVEETARLFSPSGHLSIDRITPVIQDIQEVK